LSEKIDTIKAKLSVFIQKKETVLQVEKFVLGHSKIIDEYGSYIAAGFKDLSARSNQMLNTDNTNENAEMAYCIETIQSLLKQIKFFEEKIQLFTNFNVLGGKVDALPGPGGDHVRAFFQPDHNPPRTSNDQARA